MIGKVATVRIVRGDCLPEKVSRTVFGSMASALDEVRERQRQQRMTLFLEGQVGEGDVFGRQRRAVVPARLGPQREGEDVAVGRDRHRFGKQAVERVGLVERPRHQRVVAHLHARRRVAARHEAVQRVEGRDVLVVLPVGRREIERAAFRRVRVEIAEMGEVRRIFEIAEGRQAVQRRIGRAFREKTARQKRRRGSAGGQRQEFAPPDFQTWPPPRHQFPLLYLAAKCAFLGRVDPPGFDVRADIVGCFSGMPNLFQ